VYLKHNTYRAYGYAYQNQEEIWETKIIDKLKDIHTAGNLSIEKDAFKHRLKKSIKFSEQGKIIGRLIEEGIIRYTEDNKKYIALRKR